MRQHALIELALFIVQLPAFLVKIPLVFIEDCSDMTVLESPVGFHALAHLFVGVCQLRIIPGVIDDDVP
jgi:hypothetical protein